MIKKFRRFLSRLQHHVATFVAWLAYTCIEDIMFIRIEDIVGNVIKYTKEVRARRQPWDVFDSLDQEIKNE